MIKENVKSETKSPKVKTLSEEKPSFTTVSKKKFGEGGVYNQYSWSME